MKCLSEESEYNSSEEDDNIQPVSKQENLSLRANFKPSKLEDT